MKKTFQKIRVIMLLIMGWSMATSNVYTVTDQASRKILDTTLQAGATIAIKCDKNNMYVRADGEQTGWFAASAEDTSSNITHFIVERQGDLVGFKSVAKGTYMTAPDNWTLAESTEFYGFRLEDGVYLIAEGINLTDSSQTVGYINQRWTVVLRTHDEYETGSWQPAQKQHAAPFSFETIVPAPTAVANQQILDTTLQAGAVVAIKFNVDGRYLTFGAEVNAQNTTTANQNTLYQVLRGPDNSVGFKSIGDPEGRNIRNVFGWVLASGGTAFDAPEQFTLVGGKYLKASDGGYVNQYWKGDPNHDGKVRTHGAPVDNTWPAATEATLNMTLAELTFEPVQAPVQEEVVTGPTKEGIDTVANQQILDTTLQAGNIVAIKFNVDGRYLTFGAEINAQNTTTANQNTLYQVLRGPDNSVGFKSIGDPEGRNIRNVFGWVLASGGTAFDAPEQFTLVGGKYLKASDGGYVNQYWKGDPNHDGKVRTHGAPVDNTWPAATEATLNMTLAELTFEPVQAPVQEEVVAGPTKEEIDTVANQQILDTTLQAGNIVAIKFTVDGRYIYFGDEVRAQTATIDDPNVLFKILRNGDLVGFQSISDPNGRNINNVYGWVLTAATPDFSSPQQFTLVGGKYLRANDGGYVNQYWKGTHLDGLIRTHGTKDGGWVPATETTLDMTRAELTFELVKQPEFDEVPKEATTDTAPAEGTFAPVQAPPAVVETGPTQEEIDAAAKQAFADQAIATITGLAGQDFGIQISTLNNLLTQAAAQTQPILARAQDAYKTKIDQLSGALPQDTTLLNQFKTHLTTALTSPLLNPNQQNMIPTNIQGVDALIAQLQAAVVTGPTQEEIDAAAKQAFADQAIATITGLAGQNFDAQVSTLNNLLTQAAAQTQPILARAQDAYKTKIDQLSGALPQDTTLLNQFKTHLTTALTSPLLNPNQQNMIPTNIQGVDALIAQLDAQKAKQTAIAETSKVAPTKAVKKKKSRKKTAIRKKQPTQITSPTRMTTTVTTAKKKTPKKAPLKKR